jgi:hypothetical protein
VRQVGSGFGALHARWLLIGHVEVGFLLGCWCSKSA